MNEEVCKLANQEDCGHRDATKRPTGRTEVDHGVYPPGKSYFVEYEYVCPECNISWKKWE